MVTLPTGTVTFLFTDIEGSTRLWERDPDAMATALVRHDALLRQAIEVHDGCIFKALGDSFYAVFDAPEDALQAAVQAQRALQQELPKVRVRMALHTGQAEQRQGDYFGRALNRVARLLAEGHGGQVLLSEATAEGVYGRLSADIHLRFLGVYRLRDLSQRETIYQLLAPGLTSEFPPIATPEIYFRRGLFRAMVVSVAVLLVVSWLLVRNIQLERRTHPGPAHETLQRGGASQDVRHGKSSGLPGTERVPRQ